MKLHQVQQGSPEWLQLRLSHFTASEAPAMMGCSPYMTRTELLNLKHTGVAQEVNAATQRLFDEGHAAEAKFRPIAEEIIGDDLYPVTGSKEVDGLPLLASFDGLTIDYEIGFEHKLMSEANAKAIAETGEPPLYHCYQLEHQMIVSGSKRELFAASDGTKGNAVTSWYESNPERRAAVIAGWKQFAKDLADFKPTEKVAKLTGNAPDTLPALRIELSGKVTTSNLAEFKEVALKAIRGVNRELQTDQDFADAEKSVKWCGDVESRLAAAKEHALSQTASIDQLFKTIDDIKEEARKVRLELEKLVKSKKDEIRQGIIAKGFSSLQAHIKGLNEQIGRPFMPVIFADFAGEVKGKRSIEGIQGAVSDELARAKIEADQTAERIQANLKTLLANEAHGHLFPDVQAIVLKAPEDLTATVAARIAEFERAESERKQREAEAAAKAAEAVQQAAQTSASVQAQVIQDAVKAVSPAKASPAPQSSSTIKLGEINARLAPISITAAGLSELGFEPVGKERASVLFLESDFASICAAIVNRVQSAVATA